MNASVWAPASAREMVDASIWREQARLGVHVADEVVHLLHGGRRLVDDEVGTFADHVEVVVGDERGDLDDDVTVRFEAGHLQVHPHEHRRRLGRPPPQ